MALRFDHNMTAFQSTVLPELVARALPASQCHFVNEMSPQPGYTGDTSTGSSWGQVEANAIMHGVEVWSHGWSHTDASGTDALRHEFVESRAELERVMPLVEVTGLMVPGVLGTKFDGFSSAMSDPAAWTKYEAGRIIAATYASCDGHGGILSAPGVPLGWQSLTIDTATSSASAIGVLNEAADTATGAVIMVHPRTVGGSLSLSTLREILDHIVALRDAGRIEVLTVGGLAVADPGSTWRHDLGRPLSTYTLGKGWAVTGDALTGTGPTGGAVAAINISRSAWVMGHPREAWATVTGAGTVSLTVQDVAGSPALDRTVSMTGPGTIRLPCLIPKGTTGLRFTLAVTEGTATVTGAGLRAI